MTQSPLASASKLGARLRELRSQSEVTQKALAEALGLGMSSISGYEKGTLSPPEARLRDYATFVVMRRAGDGGRLPAESELTEAQRADRDELFLELRALRPRGGLTTSEPSAGPDLWTFHTDEPIMLVVGQLEAMTHPYSDVRNPNHTNLLTYADLDALIELHGHVRARNPNSEVRFVRADQLTAADDLAGHLVMLGGPGLNEKLQQIFDGTSLPITQEEHPEVRDGEVFYVSGQGEPELPVFAGRGTPRLTGDVGLFARLTNPYNTTRTLTWCSGIYSRGVLGAVRILTDATLRDQNGAYLAARFAAATQFAILARVPVVFGGALTPDLQNEDVRLYEWSDADESEPGEAQPEGSQPEAAR
jgi:transcriptional regulator with XRE-family HTH domain